MSPLPYQFVNGATSGLSLAIGSGDVTCRLTNPGAFLPLVGWQVWIIEQELVIAMDYDGINFKITRGAEGTTPASHLAGISVYAIVSAASLKELAAEPIIDSSSAFLYDTATGDILVGN